MCPNTRYGVVKVPHTQAPEGPVVQEWGFPDRSADGIFRNFSWIPSEKNIRCLRDS